MPTAKKLSSVVTARWPHAEPCLDQPPKDPATGRRIFRARQAPFCRVMYFRNPDNSGRWGWGCEVCGRVINDESHFISTEHLKQMRQRHLPGLLSDGLNATPDGLPDPQLFVGGGNLWDLTRGLPTADIPRYAFTGWFWDCDYDASNNPEDPCDYPDDWQDVPLSFPTAYDEPDYATP